MIASLLAAVVLPASTPAATLTSADPATLRAGAEEFYLYTLPLMEVMRRRDAFLQTHPANQFVHARTLADDKAREVTTPNNDTIYSNAFIDLRGGPVTIRVPATGKRYFSLALMDAWSNNFAYFGQRVTKGKRVSVTLVGPDAKVPTGMRVVRSPTTWVWALGRTLVSGEADLPAARAVQDRLVIVGGVAGPVPPATPPRTASANALHVAALRLLKENHPLLADAPEIARFRSIGLDRPLDAADPRIATVTQGFANARRLTENARREGTVINGWIYPKRNLGEFGTDYLYRAKIAVGGLAALGRKEAIYLRLAAPTPPGLYDGKKSYRLHFAKGDEPPVDSFWSLTMYERSDDGRFYLTANPIGRYSIGDRTDGLTRNPNGSLDIWLSHDDPGSARRANWLPTPAAPFMLSLRAYLPKPALAQERWQPPAIAEVAP